MVYGARFSPDGQRVLTWSEDNTARVWSIAAGHVIAKMEGSWLASSGAEFSPDGRRVVTASAERTALVWNAATGQVIAKLEVGRYGLGQNGASSGRYSPLDLFRYTLPGVPDLVPENGDYFSIDGGRTAIGVQGLSARTSTRCW